MNQIDFLRNRYPNHVIGLSTHEYHDWDASLQIAYAKYVLGQPLHRQRIDWLRHGIDLTCVEASNSWRWHTHSGPCTRRFTIRSRVSSQKHS